MSIKLKNIAKSDFDQIYSIVSKEEVMKFVNNGFSWDKEKVQRFIDYCIIEQKLDKIKRQTYYYKIVDLNNIIIGIIGFHPMKGFKGDYLTVFFDLNQQGKGYFSKSLQELKKKIKQNKPNLKYIISLVNEKNKNMNEISKKKFVFEKKIKIKNKNYKQYKIYI